jgi:hypothetical protein
MRMLSITGHASLQGLSQPDTRLEAHEIVIGVTLRGEAKAYRLAALRDLGTLQDQVGGENLRLEYFREGDRVQVSTANGETLPHERQWWLGWSEFHPRSAIYGLQDQ